MSANEAFAAGFVRVREDRGQELLARADSRCGPPGKQCAGLQAAASTAARTSRKGARLRREARTPVERKS